MCVLVPEWFARECAITLGAAGKMPVDTKRQLQPRYAQYNEPRIVDIGGAPMI